MTVGSLFSGFGGMDYGLEQAGMIVKWQVENDDYCNRVLAKHWPSVPRYGDVREVGKHNLSPVDIVCGGFPCQPSSAAGRRRGTSDVRWLWPEFARIIGELKPRWVLAENVPGLLSVNHGRAFGEVLRDLATLGYDAEWQSIPAAAVGAPHLRWRVYIVAYPNSNRLETGRESNSRCGQMAPIFGRQIQKLRRAGHQMGSGVWDTPASSLVRMAARPPHWVERIRGCGNAVTWPVIEYIGKLIIDAN